MFFECASQRHSDGGRAFFRDEAKLLGLYPAKPLDPAGETTALVQIPIPA